MEVVVRYTIRRVECDRCGVTTELVPWAEPGAWFTRDFEETVALLAQRTDKTTITQLMGISWQTVGSIIGRVVERRGRTDLLEAKRPVNPIFRGRAIESRLRAGGRWNGRQSTQVGIGAMAAPAGAALETAGRRADGRALGASGLSAARFAKQHGLNG
jgi:hypothetical protein